MLEATLDILERELGKALWETLEMMIISVVISSIVGVILGFTLFTCKSKYFTPRPVLYQVLGGLSISYVQYLLLFLSYLRYRLLSLLPVPK